MNKINIQILEEFKKNNRIYCRCKCICGNEFLARKDNIKSGHTTSCGCLSSRNGKNLLNKKFGHLTVIKKTDKRDIAGSIIWLCACDCSKKSFIEVDTHSLLSGATQSCGCLISKGEEKIASLLSQHNIPYIKQKTFQTCRFPESNYPAKFDFYVDNKYLIEYDGIQHFENIEFFNKKNYSAIREKDEFKTKWCEDNNIPLIRIPYTLLDTLSINDLLLKKEDD